MSTQPFSIRRSTRALRVLVTVGAEGDVEVVLPPRAPQSAAGAAVTELAPWIERRRRALARAREQSAGPPGTVRYLDAELALTPQAGRQRVHRVADRLLVPVGDARPALERWYRRQARDEIAQRLDRACARAGLQRGALTIRGQKTRWASCSASGAMSFNWRLLLAPEAVVDYVVWHEVCHLEVRDHSARFWALVRRYCPEHRVQSSWLRRYGTTLTL